MKPHKLSRKGVKLIASFEGFRATPYRVNSSEQHLTIGFGHYGPDVHYGMKWSRRKARRVLRKDAAQAAAAVRTYVRVPLKQHQFDVLVSFAYNVGIGAFIDSTLLLKLNQGHYHEAAAQLARWTKDGNGVELLGLVRRRSTERRIFLHGYRR